MSALTDFPVGSRFRDADGDEGLIVAHLDKHVSTVATEPHLRLLYDDDQLTGVFCIEPLSAFTAVVIS